MEISGILRGASARVFEEVRDMAGTPDAAGDYGRGAGGDISRRIDIVAEETVIQYCRENGFGCTILGEECGRIEIPGKPGGYLVMDAIDGSANAVRGVPFFCCSLAYSADYTLSGITDGVVRDLSTGDAYWASRGRGAHLNDEQIYVSSEPRPYRIVGINTSGASAGLMRRLQPVLENHNHTRHFGANALEMALLARGLLDVYIDLREMIRVQDMAAGYLLIKEAGGIILDGEMRPLESDLSHAARLSFLAASGMSVLRDVLGDAPA